MTSKKRLSQKKRRLLVLEKYAQIKKDHGEFFTRQFIPLEEADKSEIRKKQMIIVFIASPLLVAFITSALFLTNDEVPLFVSLGIIALIIILTAVVYFGYRTALESEHKEMISGIITSKNRDSDSSEYDFELSCRETINVGRSNFYNFDLGDIVEVELLSGHSRLGLKVAVRKVGSVLDEQFDAIDFQ